MRLALAEYIIQSQNASKHYEFGWNQRTKPIGNQIQKSKTRFYYFAYAFAKHNVTAWYLFFSVLNSKSFVWHNFSNLFEGKKNRPKHEPFHKCARSMPFENTKYTLQRRIQKLWMGLVSMCNVKFDLIRTFIFLRSKCAWFARAVEAQFDRDSSDENKMMHSRRCILVW